MKTLYFIPAVLSVLLLSCFGKKAKEFDALKMDFNKFNNPVIQEIIEYQCKREANKIIEYFTDSEPIVRETAVLAMASVQNTEAVVPLLKVLANDQSAKVRMAAAFALGQTGDSTAVKKMMECFKSENSTLVKSGILENIGKCGNDSDLVFLVELVKNKPDSMVLNGALLGIARFSLRNIFSESALTTLIEILNSDCSEKTKYFASIPFVRLNISVPQKYFTVFDNSIKIAQDPSLKMNLVAALSKINTDKAFELAKEIFENDLDYRIRINALKASANYGYEKSKSLIFSALNDTMTNVAIQASELIIKYGDSKDSQQYANLALNSNNWRVRANLYTAALKFSKEKQVISEKVKKAFVATENIYEKASLIKALSFDIANYTFINQQFLLENSKVVKTYALEAIASIARDSNFNKLNTNQKKRGKKELEAEFAEIFKNAILSGDAAQVGIASEILRDTSFRFRQIYKNTYFLTQALEKCKLPAEIETYRELQKTISYFNGTKEPEALKLETIKPDWQMITGINPNQKVEVVTTKGNFILELFVNEAPMSVSNFLKLISDSFYENIPIHRTVPNFVIQHGCPRGDGWGGPDYVINSEFSMNYFHEGSLGMASAGKDTESSQWFITNSPTPHLDGRYTNFGKVLAGMEVVHQLEMGDIVKSIIILEN
ncbi:MAG: peptidylprolyl isomerase [Bacteroidales bacterium]